MPRSQILAAAGAILAVVPLVGSETLPGAQTEPTAPPPVVVEFAGSWGERGSEPGQLSQPLALATDSDGLVYVADAANRSIEKFGSRGEPRLSFTDVRLRRPTGLAVDRGGAIYAADRQANFVFVYSPEGKPLLNLRGGLGRPFRQPAAVAVDDDGEIFVLEAGARIQKFNPRGRLLKVWGREGAGPGELRQPQDLALGPDGLLYVADTGNDRIAKFTRDGAFVASWPVASPEMQASGTTSLAVSDNYAFTSNPGTAQLSAWTLDGRPVLDYDLKKHLSSMPSLPPPSVLTVDGGLGPERLALAGRDLIVVLSSTSPSVLLFRLHP
jgi:DNA-binding beta-propeller fold protein YncE